MPFLNTTPNDHARQGEPSDHFDGKRFFNPGGRGPRSLKDLLRWHFGSRPASWPATAPSPFPPDRPPRRVDRCDMRISFVGHATFLIQAGGVNILTDPVWSERVSPLSFFGPRRRNPPGIAFDDLPRIDTVLLSHCHYDHMDLATLRRLWDRDRPQIVAPLGNDTIIRRSHPAIEVTVADWNDTIPLPDGGHTTLAPAHHWSARRLGDRNLALWCAYLIETTGHRIYFAGDTGFGEGHPFQHIADRHGTPDVALLPIGAYEPRWFMQAQHMNPDDAVRAFAMLGAPQALGYHWGTFRLTDEAIEQPAQDLTASLLARGVAPARFLALRPGQTWTAPAAVDAGAESGDGRITAAS